MTKHKALTQLRIEINAVYAINDVRLDDLRDKVEARVNAAINDGILSQGRLADIEGVTCNVRVVWRGTQVDSSANGANSIAA